MYDSFHHKLLIYAADFPPRFDPNSEEYANERRFNVVRESKVRAEEIIQ